MSDGEPDRKLLFSVITPEHTPANSKNLEELFDSLLDQTFTNWEWVLYLNGTCQVTDVCAQIREHPRVKIFEAEDRTETKIGAIKAAAFALGTGDVLVEVDHDDLITPDCLEKLAEAYADPNVGFAFSDNMVLQENGEFIPYRADNGWTWREFEWKGRTLKAMRSFPPSSHSCSYIWYAPDHVRSWRASVYREIGGHDATLDICDDHDLCIRTYLATEMKHIPEALYLYRLTGNNTFLERNAEIQVKTRELFHKYARQLAERDAKKKGLMLVDLGGGLNPLPGYTVVDARPSADIVADLNEGIPLPDNSVGVVHASHILEHLHDKTKSMSEIWRVLAPGGWALVTVPSTDGRGWAQDPTHVSAWNENSFLYYTNSYLANFIDNKTVRFQSYRLDTGFPNEWMRKMHVCETTAWLVCLKSLPGQPMPRLPGLLEI